MRDTSGWPERHKAARDANELPAHAWFHLDLNDPQDWCCARCGLMRRGDGTAQSACKGTVRIGLR